MISAKEYLSKYKILKDELNQKEISEKEKANILKEMKEIRGNINKLPKPMRSILLGEYIGEKNLKEIAGDTGYTYDYIRHKKRDALKRIEAIISENKHKKTQNNTK